jgi:hypothetical protein
MIPFVVAAIDDQGQPVANIDLSLAVAMGSGSIPETVTTGEDGLATGLFTVGNQVGPVTLTAEGGGVRTAAPVFLEGAGYTGAELGTTGDTRTLADRDAWIAAVAVARAGRPFPAAQPAVAPMTGADIARLEAERRAEERAARVAALKPASQPSKPGGADASSSSGSSTGKSSSAPSDGAGGGGFLSNLGPPPPDGFGRSETRIAAHIGAMPRVYTLFVADSEASMAALLADFDTPGLNAPSLDLRGLKWFDAFGAGARYRYIYQAVELPFQDDPTQIGGSDLLLGGRYRGAIQPGLTWQVGVGFQYYTLSAFVVGSDGFEEARQGIPGARVSSGVVMDRGPYYGSLMLAAGFTPLPTAYQGELVAGYEIKPNIAVQGMFTVEARGGMVSDGEQDFVVAEGFRGIFLGVAYALP